MKEHNPVWTVGMDLGDKTHVICLLNEEGQVVDKSPIVNETVFINRYFDQFEVPRSVRVAMETGTHSPWLSHLLITRGFQVLVGNARKLRTIWENDRKDDYKDAEMLARIARFDVKLLYPVRHRSMTCQAHLAVIRSRDALVRARSMLILSSRGTVKCNGGRLAACSADAFAKKNHSLVPETLAPAINPLLEQIASLTAQIKVYDRQIELLCEQYYPETETLRQVSGVGALTALAFVLTIEESERFRKSRSVGAFLGLVPKREQSGDSDKELPISKAGNQYMRRLLVQSAHYILGPFGPDCDLRRFGQRIISGGKNGEKGTSKSRKKAATAVARKLAVLLHALWKTGDDYCEYQKTNNTSNNCLKKVA